MTVNFALDDVLVDTVSSSHTVSVLPSPPVVTLTASAVTATAADLISLDASDSFSPTDASISLHYEWSCRKV